MRNPPSRDHCVGNLVPPAATSTSSWPVALALFWYRLKAPPPRLEVNTTRSPLGDHTAEWLMEASVVRRCSVPRVSSLKQRSVDTVEPRLNTTDLASGEIAGVRIRPGAPTVSRS